MKGRYWKLTPTPDYLPEVLLSWETMITTCFPSKVTKLYLRRLRGTIACGVTINLSLIVGMIGLGWTMADSGAAKSDVTSTVFACIGAIALCLNTLSFIPELHVQLFRKLFTQFEGWYFLYQCAPAIALLGYVNIQRGQYARALAFAAGLVDAGLSPLFWETMPQIGGWKSLLTLPLLFSGCLMGFVTMLCMAWMLYSEAYEGLQDTEITFFQVPIRPWLVAADSLVVLAVLHIQIFVRQAMAKSRRRARDGQLRFCSIKWPLLLEEDEHQSIFKEEQAAVGLRPGNVVPVHPQLAANGKGLLGGGLIQVKQTKAKTKEQSNQRVKGARKVYLVYPAHTLVYLDAYEDVLHRLTRVLWRTLGKSLTYIQWPVIRKAPGVVSDRPEEGKDEARAPAGVPRLLGLEPALAGVALLCIVIQALCAGIQGPDSPGISLSFTVSCASNLLLISRAHPGLLFKLLKSFDFIVLVFSLLEYVFFSALLFEADNRTLIVLSLALTITSSFILQDAVLVHIVGKRRQYWLGIQLLLLLLLQTLCGFYLLFFVPKEESASTTHQNSTTQSILSLMTRSPLSLVLDALVTIAIYTGRSLFTLLRQPNQLVAICSPIAYEFQFIPPNEVSALMDKLRVSAPSKDQHRKIVVQAQSL